MPVLGGWISTVFCTFCEEWHSPHIEVSTFEGITAKFEYFVQLVDNLCRRHGEKKIEEWMDNHDVCRKLRISPRTLQTLRDNVTLSFCNGQS